MVQSSGSRQSFWSQHTLAGGHELLSSCQLQNTEKARASPLGILAHLYQTGEETLLALLRQLAQHAEQA